MFNPLTRRGLDDSGETTWGTARRFTSWDWRACQGLILPRLRGCVLGMNAKKLSAVSYGCLLKGEHCGQPEQWTRGD